MKKRKSSSLRRSFNSVNRSIKNQAVRIRNSLTETEKTLNKIASNEDIKNKKLIDNIAYFKNESLPFSGKFIGNNIEEEYLEGVREGYYKGEIIIDNEKFICEGRFSNGLKNGEWIIKSFQGNLKAILKYQYDRPIGEWKYFYPNGNIFEIDRFKIDLKRENSKDL